MDRLDPVTWELPPELPQGAHRNLERLRPFALRVKELRPDFIVELAHGSDTWVEIQIRKGDLTLATIAAAAPDDDYFLFYPLDDEDGGTVVAAEEAVRECDEYEAEFANWAARRRAAKWWQIWLR